MGEMGKGESGEGWKRRECGLKMDGWMDGVIGKWRRIKGVMVLWRHGKMKEKMKVKRKEKSWRGKNNEGNKNDQRRK